MASNRAAKSGIALEAQQKLASKWDPACAKASIEWIGQCLGEPLHTDGTMEDCHQQLRNGVTLGRLANWIKPGCIPASKLAKPPTMAFKCMELIELFLKSIDEANGGFVRKDELFQTVDLYEMQNMGQVILTIEAIGRYFQTHGGKGFGKAESKGQHHEWTPEQMNAGKGIIGLQMGSNQGASQAGLNYGKPRDIIS